MMTHKTNSQDDFHWCMYITIITFLAGDLAILNHPFLGCVGLRTPTGGAIEQGVRVVSLCGRRCQLHGVPIEYQLQNGQSLESCSRLVPGARVHDLTKNGCFT